MNIAGNKILITGGASGIGLGLTERFLQEGNTVIICGRRTDVLNDVAAKHAGLITRVCDLSKEEERKALYEWIVAEHSDLNILVNNAGMQQWMNVTDDNFYERAKVELNTNVEAPIHLTWLFAQLPSLSTVVNVTSGLAYVPFTRVPVYSATKAFFHSFTLSMRYQLQAKNIEVLELIPPALNTDLGGKGLHDAAPPVSDFITSVFDQLKEGKTEIAFGFSDAMTKAGPEEIMGAFKRLNP